MEFLAKLLGGKFKAPRLADPAAKYGGIGGYCGGNSVEECSKVFGQSNLERVCARCPN